MIQVRQLVKEYRSDKVIVPALRGLDLDVAAGSFTAVVGPSGSGKSTLLYVLGGMLRASSGSVRVGDLDVTRAREAELTAYRRSRLGFVFQRLNLLGALTVEDNLRLACRIAGRTRGVAARIEALLEQVGIAHRARARSLELSQGEQQRVAIARALVKEPDLVLADEPTGNLDSTNSRAVMALLRRIASGRGLTVVMITHDAECAAVADRVVALRDGRTVAWGGAGPPTAPAALGAVRRNGP
jgi:putative ABC transport system ATP-binding protein